MLEACSGPVFGGGVGGDTDSCPKGDGVRMLNGGPAPIDPDEFIQDSVSQYVRKDRFVMLEAGCADERGVPID